MFAKLLSALGLAPKTLDQAHTTFTEARQTLDSVAALFAAAGLNLEQMLAAGPDSLKLHLAELDQSAEVVRLAGELADRTSACTALEGAKSALAAALGAQGELFAALGFTPSPTSTADEIKAAWATHVQKHVTLELAKTGHPPAVVPPAIEPAGATKADAELLAEYKTMKKGPDRLAFYSKHEAALLRAASGRAS